ncbi:MAG: hypothetical protein WDM78_24120 [Puia sp.]
MLAEALNKYEGSYILVSHDRYFISKTANKIWEIEDGRIKEFKGTYDEWVEWNKRMSAQAKPSRINQKRKIRRRYSRRRPRLPSPSIKRQKKQFQKQQKLVEQLDGDIKRLQREKRSPGTSVVLLRKFMPTGRNFWLLNRNIKRRHLV